MRRDYPRGVIPTDRLYTGQRQETFGLYDYRARHYDPALGRFVSADPLVPEPGNPQGLNRYAYVLNNLLRHTDPSGHYTEEEIMRSFGAKSWDEVLALFRQGGILEGRWGWLEILRRAKDGYIVYSRPAADHHLPNQPTFANWPGGFFGRNDAGEILVNGRSHVEFALQFNEYWLRSPALPADPALFPDAFYTRANWLHSHPHLRWQPDWAATKRDLASMGIDIIGTAAMATGTPEGGIVGGVALGFGVYLDLESFAEGLSRVIAYRELGAFTSRDLANIVGIIPVVGMYGEWHNLISHFTGLYVEITP
jgi:RHS repeat-associated protein